MDMKTILDKRIEEFVLVLTMLVMVFIVFFQAASRYVFGTSLSWGSELAQYLHVWQIWVGASLAIRVHAHISVDVFINLFPETVKKILRTIGLLFWFVFAGFLAFEGTKYVLNVLASGQTSPSLQVPMWIPYLAIPIGGLLMCIRLIQRFYFLVTDHEDFYKDEEEIQ